MADIRSNEPGRTGTEREISGTTDWTSESDYWRNNYASRPYVSVDRDFWYYEPGYRYGFESASQYPGRTWDAVQDDLERGWEQVKDRGEAKWNEIKAAARDAWDRVRNRT